MMKTNRILQRFSKEKYKTFYINYKRDGNSTLKQIRFNSSLSGNLNNQKYFSKNKLNKTKISKIYEYLKNTDLHNNDSILNNIKLLESRISSHNFIHDYIHVDSFQNINYCEDDFISNFYSVISKNDNELMLDKIHNIEDILNYKIKFNNILKDLDDKCIYKMIFRWQSIDVDNFGNHRSQFSTSPSFFIYPNMDINNVLYKFINNLNIITTKYSVADKIHLDVFIKEWITFEEFKSFDQILDIIKKSDSKSLGVKQLKNNLITNGFFDKDLINNSRKFYVCVNVNGLNYGDRIDGLMKKEVLNKLNILNENDKIVLYKTNIKNNNYLIKVEEKDNLNIVNVYLWRMAEDQKDNLLELETWSDSILYNIDENGYISNTIVNRISNNTGHHIKFINDKLIKVDIVYNSKKLISSYNDFDKDINIGAIDIETYNNSNGDAVPYCIGLKTEDLLKTLYINDYDNCDDMILDFINSICISKYHNIKLYAHNMSEFDGLIILKSLIKTSYKHDYKIKIFSDNEGKIMSIDITKKLNNKKVIKISILDSYLLLPVNLDYLCRVFNTEVKKSIFPYDFVNANTLNYVGNVPEFNYFNKLNYTDYVKYSQTYQVWDTKKETLEYLERDLISLYEVISKFNNIIFDKFKINITRVRSISGLAFLIYTSKYYDDNKTPIYYSKGKLEKFIRRAYIGGIVDVMTQYTDYTTYKYDVNSHYPNAMLLPMPGGLPKISSETNLDNIFGFVEAIVEAPSEQDLKVAILPVKLNDETILFRNTVSGVWWSEELKMARSYGYKIHEILSCVQFDKVEGTFDNYIKDIYKCKSDAELDNNMVERYIYKLLLNSLYGRLGLRQQNFKLSLIEDKKLQKILHTENSEVLFKCNDLNLVRSSGPIDPELIRIISKEKLYESNDHNFNAANSWGSNKSSVQYSAAITAYSRMYLNQFKNIADNTYLGGDTDSIIMSKPLEDKFVGKNLGQFKLEYIIDEAFYHSKKFYLIVTNENKIIIKAKGIDNSKNELNYQIFVDLFTGKTIKIKQIQFNKNFKTLNINISYIEKHIKGITDPDINYKMNNRKLILYDNKLHSLIKI